MNTKKIIPYGKQNINEEDINSVVNVLRSDFLTQGPKVPEFEKSIAKKVDASFSIAVNSATSALHISCLALGVSNQDIVWTSPVSFLSSANCALFCGASIDFVDIEASSGLMDITALETKLKRSKVEGNLPKVVIPVHLAGSSCDMEKIYKLSKEYNFSIIEDASHALGGKYFDNPVGSCKYSDICVFSFHPVKIICTAEGGIATTNSEEIYNLMMSYRTHGVERNPDRMLQNNPPPWSYEQHFLGFNYRMNDIQAALGISQLKRLDQFVESRNRIYQRYRESFNNQEIKLLSIPKGVSSSVHLSIILLSCNDIDIHRKIFEEMRSKGIWVQLHYYPIHLQPYYINLGFKKGDFPEAENYSSKALSLPTFPSLNYTEQTFVINTLNSLIRKYNKINEF